MTSDNTTPAMPDKMRDDQEKAGAAMEREVQSAKEQARKAGETIRDSASGLADKAKDKVLEQADHGMEAVTSGMGDFAAAVKKAADELGERDQSMAANVVREVANGLESVSQSVQGKSIQDITRSVTQFARRQPTTFLVGAALAGVALGRFARASNDHDAGQESGATSWDSSSSQRAPLASPSLAGRSDTGSPMSSYGSGMTSPASQTEFGDDNSVAKPDFPATGASAGQEGSDEH